MLTQRVAKFRQRHTSIRKYIANNLCFFTSLYRLLILLLVMQICVYDATVYSSKICFYKNDSCFTSVYILIFYLLLFAQDVLPQCASLISSIYDHQIKAYFINERIQNDIKLKRIKAYVLLTKRNLSDSVYTFVEQS